MSDDATAKAEGEQVEFDPYSVSIEELGQRLESADLTGETATVEPPEVIDDDSALSEQPEEVEEEVAVEADGDGSDAESTDVEAEQATEASDAEDEGVDLQELLLARLEEAEARGAHLENQLGRFTGGEGFWKKRAQELEQRVAQPVERDSDDEYVERPAAAPAAPAARDDVTTYLVAQAVERAGQDFLRNYPDAVGADGKLHPEMAQVLSSTQNDFQDLLRIASPIEAQERTTALLASAHSRYHLNQVRARRLELESRRVDQAARLKDKKRASASASPGRKKPSASNKRGPNPMTMPLDELRKRLEAGEL